MVIKSHYSKYFEETPYFVAIIELNCSQDLIGNYLRFYKWVISVQLRVIEGNYVPYIDLGVGSLLSSLETSCFSLICSQLPQYRVGYSGI